jgi:hypothetical protein
MLNPDGAALYTRENANKVDLNRDSQALTRSKLLRAVLKSLNLIIVLTFTISALFFGVSDTGKPATLSFSTFIQ